MLEAGDRLGGQVRTERHDEFVFEAGADSLHGISIWAFWDSLRADVGLSPQQARCSVVTIMTSLLREAGFSI